MAILAARSSVCLSACHGVGIRVALRDGDMRMALKQSLALHHMENVVLPVVAKGGALDESLTSWEAGLWPALTWAFAPVGLLLYRSIPEAVQN